MHPSRRPNNSRSSDPPGARPTPIPTPHHDRSHRDRPSPPHTSHSHDPTTSSNSTDDKEDKDDGPPQPKGKLGSYQMRQGLRFNMETPKFLQQLKAQVGGNTSTRFSCTGTQSAESEAKRRRAIQGESELDDDGPLVVMPDDAADGGDMDERDLQRLRLLHPNAVMDGVAMEEPVVAEQASRAGPPVDPMTGKLLFQAKQMGSGAESKQGGGAVSVGKKAANLKSEKGRESKAPTTAAAAAKSAGKKKKGGSHLLSFDE